MSVWKREEIAQKTWMTFLGFALISFTLTSFGTIQMTEIQLMRYIMRDPGGMSDLLFAAIPPIIIALAFGAVMTLWKMIRPSSK